MEKNIRINAGISQYLDFNVVVNKGDKCRTPDKRFNSVVVNILPLPSASYLCPKQDALVIGYNEVYGSDGIPPITSVRNVYANYIYSYSGSSIFISLKVMRELASSLLMYPNNIDWSAKTNAESLIAKPNLKNSSLTLYCPSTLRASVATMMTKFWTMIRARPELEGLTSVPYISVDHRVTQMGLFHPPHHSKQYCYYGQ